MWNKLRRLYFKARRPVAPAQFSKGKAQHIRSTLQDVGKNVFIGDLVSLSHPMMLVIGNSVRIEDFCILNSEGGIRIGDYAYISHGVTIDTSSPAEFDFKLNKWKSMYYRPVHIHRAVYIGRNVRIVPGVIIGEGARIASNSVVERDVKAGEVIGDHLEFVPSDPRSKETSFHSWKTFMLQNSILSSKGKHASDLGQNLFFIVSTGRAGSQTIAKVLSKHPQVECRHESKGELIRLSTEYAHGVKSRDEIKEEIIELYNCASNIHSLVYGESDNKISNLISIFYEIFPSAKFIWVVRNARDVVASTFSRGMFDDREYGLPFRDKIGIQKISSSPIHSIFRINGGRIDDGFSIEAWNSASPFERNCWYWNYWNRLIERQLEEIPENSWAMVRLEYIEEDFRKVTSLLRLESFNFKMEHTNKARYHLEKKWNDQNERLFTEYCGELDSRLYPKGS